MIDVMYNKCITRYLLADTNKNLTTSLGENIQAYGTYT